jgi:hypothetical protein
MGLVLLTVAVLVSVTAWRGLGLGLIAGAATLFVLGILLVMKPPPSGKGGNPARMNFGQ